MVTVGRLGSSPMRPSNSGKPPVSMRSTRAPASRRYPPASAAQASISARRPGSMLTVGMATRAASRSSNSARRSAIRFRMLAASITADLYHC